MDALIETAGTMLFDRIGAAIDKWGVAVLLPDTAPLLKIHGCWAIDPVNTVWAPGQLSAEPVASRITGSAEWLSVRLLAIQSEGTTLAAKAPALHALGLGRTLAFAISGYQGPCSWSD